MSRYLSRFLPRLAGVLLPALPLLAAAEGAGQDYRLKLPPNPFGAQPVITRLYSQNLLFFVPTRFVQLRAQDAGDQYTREYVLKGETGEQWTQMITVTATRNVVGKPGVTPRGILAAMAQGYREGCPRTFAATDLGETALSGFPAQVAAIGCGAEGKQPPPYSEQTLIIAIQGLHDLYTVQWAERSKPVKKAPVFNVKVLEKRVGELMPLRLCESQPGQNPPFADCLRAPEHATPATPAPEPAPTPLRAP